MVKCRVIDFNYGSGDSDWMEMEPDEFTELNNWLEKEWCGEKRLETYDPTPPSYLWTKESLFADYAAYKEREARANESKLAKKLRQYEKLKKELGID